MLYFAYGSNLNLFQMKRRQGLRLSKKYELKGYRLNLEANIEQPILKK